MKIKDLISFSLQSFKNRKSRMILTVLGVAVAIGVIMFLVSLGYGLQKTILERITTEDSILTLDIYPPESESILLDKDSLEQIREIPEVKLISPQAVVTAQIGFNDLTSETSVNVVDTDFFRLAGMEADLGTLLDEEKHNSIVVSPVVADLFAVTPEELIGQQVSLDFRIVQPTPEPEPEGIIVTSPEGSIASGSAQTEEKTTDVHQEFTIVGVTSGLDDSNQVYIRLTDASALNIEEYQFVKAQVENQSSLEPVRESIIEMGFLVSALSDVVYQANQIFSIIQIVLAVFGIFSLFVAAIGLINTMTISLLERINEIGIMRAIGASAWDIRKIFLIESTLIGFFGGIVGIMIGKISGWLFNGGLALLAKSMGAQPVYIFHTPIWFIGFIIAFSALVGLISGIMPARKAGKLNALEALRYK